MFDRDYIALEKILICFGIVLVVLLWIALLLGEFGLFYSSIIGPLTLITLSVAGYWLFRKKNLPSLTKIGWSVLIVILVIAIFQSYFFHDTFFSNRDEGVYVQSAIFLSNNHSFRTSELPIQTMSLARQNSWFQPNFHFGYISWLGLNYSVLGILGIKISNILLIVVFLLSIYLIARKLGGHKAGLMTCFLLGFSYPYLWFWRRTVAENLIAALVWFGLYCGLKLLRSWNRGYLFLSLLSFGFALHVKIEAIFIYILFSVSLFAMILLKKSKVALLPILYISVPILVHYIYYLVVYKTSELNNILIFLHSIGFIKLSIPILNDGLMAVLPNALHYHLPQFTYHILSQYALYFPLMFIVLFSLVLVLRKKREKILDFFFLLFVLSPLFITLMYPSIVYDQPWMLRRYIVAIFPFAFLALSVFFSHLSHKFLSTIVFIALFTTNLYLARPILFLSEYDGTVQNIRDIIQEIPKNSIVFVDRFTFTDYYEIDGTIFFMYGIPATRTFYDNIENTTIPPDTSVYFITHNNSWRNDQDVFSQFFPRDTWDLISQKTYLFTNLQRTCELLKQYGSGGLVGRLPIDQALLECTDIPRSVEHMTTKVIMYKINSQGIREYLDKQTLLNKYSQESNIYLQPRSSYINKNGKLVCTTSPCIIRYYLPNKDDYAGLLLFAKPQNYAPNFRISISTDNDEVTYSIYNFNTEKYVNISPQYTTQGNLLFDADNSFFQETNVLHNYINVNMTSLSPIVINNITVTPIY